MSIRQHVFLPSRCIYCGKETLDNTLYPSECVEREAPLVYTSETGKDGTDSHGFASEVDERMLRVTGWTESPWD